MKKSRIFLIIGLALVLVGGAIWAYNSPAPAEPQPDDGDQAEVTTIEGSLGYPSQGIPDDLKVCARSVTGNQEYCTKEKLEDDKYKFSIGYKISVPEGEYFLNAARPETEDLQGYYTKYVECGMEKGCNSHKPLPVSAAAGEKVENIDILDWQQFPQDVNIATKKDLIKLESPKPFEVATSPIVVTGQASGSWFFEADFPVRIETKEGNLVTSTQAVTRQDWMTEEFIPFETQLDYSEPQGGYSYIVLKKANPSGLPEHADELRIPVYLK